MHLHCYRHHALLTEIVRSSDTPLPRAQTRRQSENIGFKYDTLVQHAPERTSPCKQNEGRESHSRHANTRGQEKKQTTLKNFNIARSLESFASLVR